jgi:nicotinamide-nucleotide amidase
MHAEIISIGDEITSGQLLDTNSQWLSLRLEELGVHVLYHTTVGDDLEAMVQVFRQAFSRSDVIVTTGGLGPTADDLTREALAKATGRKLAMDPHALEHIRELFARRKREMPKSNEVQAMFPEGSRVVHNPHGTAPGIDIEVSRCPIAPCRLFALPGVPAEMKELWFGTLAQELRKIGAGQRVIKHRRIKCFGAGESQMEAMLPDLIRRGREPRVGINASQATIIFRVTATGPTEEAAQSSMEPVVATMRKCLGNLVFGEEDDELQDAVVRLLRQHKKTLATVEWGTAGLVADWLGAVAEGQGHYLGGLVLPGETAVRRLLDLPPHKAATAGRALPGATADPALPSATSGRGFMEGATSGRGFMEAPEEAKDLVAAMAEACRKRFGSDYALGVGPFPKSAPGATEPKPFFFALATADGVTTKSVPFAAHPALLKILAAKQALNMVRLAMMKE